MVNGRTMPIPVCFWKIIVNHWIPAIAGSWAGMGKAWPILPDYHMLTTEQFLFNWSHWHSVISFCCTKKIILTMTWHFPGCLKKPVWWNGRTISDTGTGGKIILLYISY